MSERRQATEPTLEWVRRELDHLSWERMSGDLSPERERRYRVLCAAERRLLDARTADRVLGASSSSVVAGQNAVLDGEQRCRAAG